MKKIVFVSVLLLAILARAAEERPREYADPDVQRLLHVSVFAFGGVGFAGITSDGETAFGAIVRKKEAIRFTIAAFEYGNEPARCYALIALRELSPELFRESIARVRKNPPKKITMMSGCIMSDVEPEKLYDAIEAGNYAEYFERYEKKG